MGSTTETSKTARLQNDFGADYWVRDKEAHRVSIHIISTTLYFYGRSNFTDYL
jgi:hypothetical protein